MVGSFPPPIHGMSLVNEAILNQIKKKSDHQPQIVDIASNSLQRSIFVRLNRIPKVLLCLGRMAMNNHKNTNTLYMSISGGLGQVYEIFFAFIARFKCMQIFLHHHSFAYLDKPNRLTSLLTKITGRKAIHIALSQNMADRLRSIYKIGCVTAVSNAVFLIPDEFASAKIHAREEINTLGFLSNISAEKGVFEFIKLFVSLRNAGFPLRAKLAGPFQDLETERKVIKQIALFTRL